MHKGFPHQQVSGRAFQVLGAGQAATGCCLAESTLDHLDQVLVSAAIRI